MKKKVIFTTILNVCKELGATSSIHAIPNIIRTKYKTIKIIWTIFFLTSFALCSYLVIESVFNYLDYQVITEIRSVNDFPSVLPKVTICNSNFFATNYSMQFLTRILKDNSIHDIFNSSILDERFPPDEINSLHDRLEFARYLAQSYAASPLMSDADKKRLGYDLSQMMLTCEFGGNSCSYADFEWTFDFEYGSCFAFNYDSSKPKSVTRTGKADGLLLELYAGVPDHVKTFSFNSGVVVFLGNDSMSLSSHEPIDVPVGKETNIIVNRIFTQQMKKPYSNCDLEDATASSFSSVLYKEVFKAYKSYSQRDCYDLCYQLAVIENCSCYDQNFDSVGDNVAPCLSFAQIDCVYQVYYEFPKTKISDRCDPYCPLECKSLTLSVAYSQSEYPSVNYAEALKYHPVLLEKYSKSEISYEMLKENILRVNVYYDKLKYMVITESAAVNVISLLSNIGGKMRLYIRNEFFFKKKN
jgi:hypothetical protein